MTTFLLLPSESVLPAGWRESLDPFAPLPSGLDPETAEAHAARLTSEFAARCSAIDAQLRRRLADTAELTFLSGIRAWTVTLGNDVTEATLAQTIAGIPVDIAPETTFTAL